MKRLYTAAAALLTGVFFGCGRIDDPSGGTAEPKSAAVKPASTPREAVTALAAAYRAKDLEAVLAVFADDAREATRAMIEAFEASQTLDAALDAKFGRDPDAKAPVGVRDRLMAVLDVAPIGEIDYLGPDRARLRVEETVAADGGATEKVLRDVVAVREREVWKLIPAEFEEAHPRLNAADARRFRATAERVLGELQAGKYTSREEVRQALDRKPPAVGPQP